jgi:hypothetical protein
MPKLGGRPAGLPPSALSLQPVCKPGSGWPAGRTRRRDGHSSGTPVTRRLQQPTRTAGSGHRSRSFQRLRAKSFAPSLFGLAPGGVCRAACVTAGAVRSYRTVSPLPSLPQEGRRSVLCGTVPGLAPAGCYPAPLVHGARTFLPGSLPREGSRAAVRPTDREGNGVRGRRRQGPMTRRSKVMVRARAAIVRGRWR